jgi:hypothetical protein
LNGRAHLPFCCNSRFGVILGHDVELWQRDRKVAVFHHKAEPPIAMNWPTVAIGRNWSGGLEQARGSWKLR